MRCAHERGSATLPSFRWEKVVSETVREKLSISAGESCDRRDLFVAFSVFDDDTISHHSPHQLAFLLGLV